ncbi:MAG: DUF302 domain-containing protein [Weeksellaceae bacterium]|jgi:uncharacterized protein (DUF302 family)|nr:DUF302 domain-containing protein [Weeksellaceae bacterium]
MSYTFSKIIELDFDTTVQLVIQELKKEGFGVLSEIDIKKTLNEKLNVDFRKYKILGACNPGFAYRALLSEPEIGSMLPCNVVVQETDGGVRVSAVDPVASMMAVKNNELGEIAVQVRDKLKRVIENI